MSTPSEVLSVAQLTRRIRTLLEIQIGAVWVEGEIGTLRPNRSGHVYFTLKDEQAALSCVLFRSAAARLGMELREGMKVRAFGEISVYEAQGKYQLVVSRMMEQGLGALQARFEELKRRLDAEGLFSAERKRALPRFPQTIGVVTSPTGAALRDILHVLGRRAPWVRVIVAPTAVQGDGAAEQIAKALALLTSGGAVPVPDVIIAGRGGGGMEDLWAFNEEVVARAIVACPVPVVSAVGHEIDFTIADFAADLRAPTPSAAAELVVPDGAELRRRLDESAAGMRRMLVRRIAMAGRLLAQRSAASLRRAPVNALRQAELRLDAAGGALFHALVSRLADHGSRLDEAGHSLVSRRPDVAIERVSAQVARLGSRAGFLLSSALDRATHRCERAGVLLQSLSPTAVLQRGFSLTLGPDGKALRAADDVRPGDRITTRLATGSLTSRVEQSGGS